MSRPQNHQLPLLSLPKKIAASLVLLGGWTLFLSAWFASVILTSWSALGIFDLGDNLTVIRDQSPGTFRGLLIIHPVSVLMMGLVLRGLFNKTALPRGVKVLIQSTLLFIFVIDLLFWALLPYSQIARTLLGPILVLESITLFAMMLLPLKEMWIYSRWNSGGKKVRVAIVGGGFGGIYTALGLDKALGYHPDLEIILIDKKNYFLFPPLLPGVAVGAIETRQVTNPFRRIFEATNVIFRKETVESIDFDTRKITTRVSVGQDPDSQVITQSISTLTYDYLVLAPGSETNTFNTEGAEEYSFFMKEIGDAIAVRNHIIDCFELAAREANPSIQRELLRFVVVGAGATGVELASEIVDLISHILLRRYPEIDANFVEVYLVQSGNQILPGWNDLLVRRTTEQLSHLRIKLLLNTRVTKVGSRTISFKTGETLGTRTVMWCTGVKPAPFLSSCNIPKEKTGRVLIKEDLRSVANDLVFVLGDAAHLVDPKTGQAYPTLAQVAFQQGNQTATNLVRLVKGAVPRPFKYFNYGSLISAGEHFAVVDLMGIRLTGFVAWMIWRALYVGKLVGLSNRFRVLLDWTLDLLMERSISQIWTSRDEVQKREPPPPATETRQPTRKAETV